MVIKGWVMVGSLRIISQRKPSWVRKDFSAAAGSSAGSVAVSSGGWAKAMELKMNRAAIIMQIAAREIDW